jgi:hypothetical protein
MKRIFSLLFLLSTTTFLFAQTNEFELKVTFKPFKHQFIYLGYHYGKQKPIIDSVLLDDNSTGVFKRAKKMEKGVYLIGFPNKTGYFEVLIDKDQKFAVIADSANLIPSMKFVGSPDNTLFLQYQNYASLKGREIEDGKKTIGRFKNKSRFNKMDRCYC